MLSARQGELSPFESDGLVAHLATCADCQARLADDRALSTLVGPALMAEANAVNLAPLTDAVMKRVAGRKGFGGWRLLMAPVMAAAALLFVVLRPDPVAPPVPGPVAVAHADLEVTSEGYEATILETEDGPVVLLNVEEG
jgi:hypothetical protein